MANLFPGATWRPMPGQEKRPKRRKGRGVGFHVAVYRGPSIYDINLRTGNDAHLYVRFDGSVEQNVDLDLQAWAGADGNPSMIWVETEGGADPKTVNTELWTPAQAVTLARIARYAHDTEGTPLQLMPDSRPGSRGIGTHRLGIQHSRGVGTVPGWLIAGGERWTKHLGKECPGNAKVAQVPSIIAAALEDDMTPDELMDWPFVTLADGRAISFGEVVKSMDRNIGVLQTQVAALEALLAKPPVAGGASLDAAKLLADVGAVVRDALGADNAAQADEIVDRLAARLGKPATV